MISSTLFLFLDRVARAKLGILIEKGEVRVLLHLDDVANRAADKLCAQIADDLGLQSEIRHVFGEGDFDWRYLHNFLTEETPATVARLWPQYVRA